MGKSVSFPIKIRSRPIKMPFLKEYQRELLEAFTRGFAPTISNSNVDLSAVLLKETGEVDCISAFDYAHEVSIMHATPFT